LTPCDVQKLASAHPLHSVPSSVLSDSDQGIVVHGIDLAWGDRNPDGICRLVGTPSHAKVEWLSRTLGDANLVSTLKPQIQRGTHLLAIDAPLICHNPTGSRPVDSEVQRQFGRYRCGAYPVNQRLCPRPLRTAKALQTLGFVCDCRPPSPSALHMMEVYPHTALVRRFSLSERIPYKKGPLDDRRRAFSRLQGLLEKWLEQERVDVPQRLSEPLEAPWTKGREDLIDALICSLIGYHHWKYQGVRSQVLGESDTGFLVTLAER